MGSTTPPLDISLVNISGLKLPAPNHVRRQVLRIQPRSPVATLPARDQSRCPVGVLFFDKSIFG